MMTEIEKKKATRKLNREMSHRRNYRGTPTKLSCDGGPFHGADIFLQTQSSAIFTVRKWSGHYVEKSVGYHRTQTALWVAA